MHLGVARDTRHINEGLDHLARKKIAERVGEITVGVLGKVGKSLVQLIQGLGVQAVSISGKDAGLLTVEKKYSNGEDIGFVGEITDVNPKILYDLLEKDFIPIVCPVGMDKDFNTYNINADTAAARIAGALKAESLISMTDTVGLCYDKDDPSTLIPKVCVSDTPKLVRDGVIVGGMIPKIQCCCDAIRRGVRKVFIIDGRIPHAILIDILTDEGIGTMVVSGNKI